MPTWRKRSKRRNRSLRISRSLSDRCLLVANRWRRVGVMHRHARAPVIERQREDVAGFGQYQPGMVEHLRAGGGQSLQATATPLEDQKPQLVLEPLDLLGKSRLRGVHASGGVGDVEAGISDGNEIAKLGESHLGRPGCGGGKRHDTRCSRVSSWACASTWNDTAASGGSAG